MKVLLDTCTFLWIAWDDSELSPAARELYQDDANEVYLSVASAWEIAIKAALHKIKLPIDARLFVPTYREKHGVLSLQIEEETALHAGRLPRLHSDPFDRLIVAQALLKEMVIVSPDPLIAQYGVRTAW